MITIPFAANYASEIRKRRWWDILQRLPLPDIRQLVSEVQSMQAIDISYLRRPMNRERIIELGRAEAVQVQRDFFASNLGEPFAPVVDHRE